MFDMAKTYLFSEDNIEKARGDVYLMVKELVEDTDNDWDDQVASMLFKFLKMED